MIEWLIGCIRLYFDCTAICQTREALLKILGDLAEDDHFGLITFDSSVSTWRKELLPANQDNLEAAKSFARNIHERGGSRN